MAPPEAGADFFAKNKFLTKIVLGIVDNVRTKIQRLEQYVSIPDLNPKI